MKNLIVSAVCIAMVMAVASLKAAEVDEKACKELITTNCTKCHGTKKICNELKEEDADAKKWREIITEMGKKGHLSQEIQDSVHACLTTSADPGKLVCE